VPRVVMATQVTDVSVMKLAFLGHCQGLIGRRRVPQVRQTRLVISNYLGKQASKTQIMHDPDKRLGCATAISRYDPLLCFAHRNAGPPVFLLNLGPGSEPSDRLQVPDTGELEIACRVGHRHPPDTDENGNVANSRFHKFQNFSGAG
jgi:hypothetical protein